MALASGTRFGPYEVVEQIGSGGMGEVWRTRDTNLKRDVAVKVLPESFAADADRLARFRREAEVLASLNHPNIATIHGLEQADGQTVIVMELVEGPTLADRIAEGPISPDEALGIARQVVDGLEVAHGRQIVHRDLKPANIKLKDDGTIKVLDFGISKPIDASAISGGSPVMTTPAMTETGVILGTAAYMSPEQARGRFVDQRTDIWAFGCLLFEMLTGQPAFGGEDIMATLARVIDRDTDMSSMPGTISPAVRHTITLCLEKDPNKRISDIRDVRLALEGKFEATSPPAMQPVARRHWSWVASVVMAAVAASAAAWYLKPVPNGRVVRFTHVLEEDQQFVSGTGRQVVAVSPDGSMVVYATNQRLYARRIDTLQSSPIPGTNENPLVPFFSPDGQWVGYWSAVNGQLKKIIIAGGAPVTIADAGAPYGPPSWEDDGTIIWGQSEGIMRVSANGGVPDVLVPSDGDNLASPTLLPDGKTLLFYRGGTANGELTVQSVESGERKSLGSGTLPRYLRTGHLVYGSGDVLFAQPFDIGALEARGGPVPVVEGVQGTPMQYAISDSGSLVYIPGTGGSAEAPRTLALVDRDGDVQRLNVRPAPYVMPAIAPDGSRVAVQTLNSSGTGAIWIYDLSGDTQIRQLTQEGNNARPIWAPDGEHVTYASDREGPRSIYWQPADGRGLPERLTTAPEGSVDAPQSWSGDGTKLSFVRVSGGDTGVATTGGLPFLWVLSLDANTEPEQIYEAQTGLSDFSPDGEWLAYAANSSGRWQIYVQPFPPTGLVHQITQEGGIDPQWSSDGGELFFIQPDSGQIIAIDITTEGAFGFGNERPLPIDGLYVDINYKNYDVAPDDHQFLVVLPTDETGSGDIPRPQIIVVENWFEELKNRVPKD